VGDDMLQKVARRSVTAGIGPAQVTDYQRFSPSYHRMLACSWEEPTKNKEFIGYGRVIEDAKPGSQILKRTDTLFNDAWTGATATYPLRLSIAVGATPERRRAGGRAAPPRRPEDEAKYLAGGHRE
jgi:hypothetical protein